MSLLNFLIRNGLEKSSLNINIDQNEEFAEDSIVTNSQKKIHNIQQNQEYYINNLEKINKLKYIHEKKKHKGFYYYLNFWRRNETNKDLFKLLHLELQSCVLYPCFTLIYLDEYSINNAQETLYYLDIPIDPFLIDTKYNLTDFLYFYEDGIFKTNNYLFIEFEFNNFSADVTDANSIMNTLYDGVQRITVMNSENYFCENIPKHTSLKWFTFSFLNISKLKMTSKFCVSTNRIYNRKIYESYIKYNKIATKGIHKKIENCSKLTKDTYLLEIPFFSYFIDPQEKEEDLHVFKLSLEIRNPLSYDDNLSIYKFILDKSFKAIAQKMEKIVEDYTNKKNEYFIFLKKHNNTNVYSIKNPQNNNNYVRYLCKINNINFGSDIVKTNIESFNTKQFDDDLFYAQEKIFKDIKYVLKSFTWD